MPTSKAKPKVSIGRAKVVTRPKVSIGRAKVVSRPRSKKY